METKSINPEIKDAVGLLKTDLTSYFGERIDRIILYGSYARGDYRKDSDVDIMVLLKDKPDLKDENYVDDISYDHFTSHNIFFTVILQTANQFESVLDFYPFYRNVQNEGVPL